MTFGNDDSLGVAGQNGDVELGMMVYRYFFFWVGKGKKVYCGEATSPSRTVIRSRECVAPGLTERRVIKRI